MHRCIEHSIKQQLVIQKYCYDLKVWVFQHKFYLNKIHREINPQNQEIIPKEWITTLRPRRDRLVQIQQTRDFITVLQHFYDRFCADGYFNYIFYVEDDFMPCMDEYEQLVRILKWAKVNHDRVSFVG